MVKHKPGHTEHTDDCMSDWAEKCRGSMSKATIQANHRLHMFDAAVAERAAQFCYSNNETAPIKITRRGEVKS